MESVVRLYEWGLNLFLDLCDMLHKEGGLQPTQRATIEEQVAKCL